MHTSPGNISVQEGMLSHIDVPFTLAAILAITTPIIELLKQASIARDFIASFRKPAKKKKTKPRAPVRTKKTSAIKATQASKRTSNRKRTTVPNRRRRTA